MTRPDLASGLDDCFTLHNYDFCLSFSCLLYIFFLIFCFCFCWKDRNEMKSDSFSCCCCCYNYNLSPHTPSSWSAFLFFVFVSSLVWNRCQSELGFCDVRAATRWRIMASQMPRDLGRRRYWMLYTKSCEALAWLKATNFETWNHAISFRLTLCVCLPRCPYYVVSL